MNAKNTIYIVTLFCACAIAFMLHAYLKSRIIASATTKNGDTFVVAQRWNGALDGYITDVVHTNRIGFVTIISLDGDDDRYSKVPMLVDEENQLLTIKLSHDREKRVSYKLAEQAASSNH
jgi:hypothetical protein